VRADTLPVCHVFRDVGAEASEQKGVWDSPCSHSLWHMGNVQQNTWRTDMAQLLSRQEAEDQMDVLKSSESLLWLVQVIKACVLSVLVYCVFCHAWMFLSHVV
jgi:hypothetical protein